MKDTMNSRNVAKYHKLLDAGESLAKISAFLRITESTLEKFTPEIVAAHKARVKVAIATAVRLKAIADGTTVLERLEPDKEVVDPVDPVDPDNVVEVVKGSAKGTGKKTDAKAAVAKTAKG